MSLKDHQHKQHHHGAFEMSNNGWEQGNEGASQAPDPRQDHAFDKGWPSSSVHVTNQLRGAKVRRWSSAHGGETSTTNHLMSAPASTHSIRMAGRTAQIGGVPTTLWVTTIFSSRALRHS